MDSSGVFPDGGSPGFTTASPLYVNALRLPGIKLRTTSCRMFKISFPKLAMCKRMVDPAICRCPGRREGASPPPPVFPLDGAAVWRR